MRAILTYHSIDDSGSPISIAPSAFARHVAWLASGTVQVEPLESLPAGGDVTPDGRHRVAITFDDAFVNFGTLAWPQLRNAGLPATVFVVSQHVGRTNRWSNTVTPGIPELPLLTWEALAACAASGATIGAHSRTHPHLPALSPDAVDEQLRGCQDDLQTHLGLRATSFAYPYGDVSPAVAAAAARHFAVACTTDYRPLGDGEAAHLLPRLDMFYFQAPAALDDWGQRRFLRRIATRRALRGIRQWMTALADSSRTPTEGL